MCKLIEWPDYDQADAFRFNKVINEPDFLPLYVVRQLAQAATLLRAQRGKLMATPLGKYIAISFHPQIFSPQRSCADSRIRRPCGEVQTLAAARWQPTCDA